MHRIDCRGVQFYAEFVRTVSGCIELIVEVFNAVQSLSGLSVDV